MKPHGALYNTVVTDSSQAQAVVAAVRAYDPKLAVLGLPGSQLLRQAEASGLTGVAEAFADRAYTGDGLLLPRRAPGAVLHDAEVIAERCVRLATEGKLEAADGTMLTVRVRSVCVHGDTPHSVDIARRIRHALTDAGVRIGAFVGGAA